MEKIDARKLAPEVQQQLRNQAIRLRKSGRKYKEIAEIVGVHFTTVCEWCKRCEREGVKAIQVKKRGRPHGSCRTLNSGQEKEIQQTIYDKCPDQLKLPFALWTRIAVQQLIKERFCIDMPIRSTGEYLKRWGFTPQKPLRRAYKQNPKTVQKWLDEEYPNIEKRAKAENTEIHWGDEIGLCNESRSYPLRDQGLHPNIGERINLIFTVTNQGKVRFMVYENKMDSGTMIKFMERLIKGVDRKVFLILDNLKVHHNPVIKEWLAEHKDRIEVFFLSSVSTRTRKRKTN